MNSAHDPCACAARSRSNATSCSAWWHSRSIKYSASRSSGPRRPERRPLRPREHRENSPRSMNFARGSKVIISLTGPSKSGKTVLVKKVVGENLIPLSGATIRSGDALWSKVLGWMEVPDQRTEKTETAISMEATANAGGKIGVPLVAQGEAKAGGKLGGERTYGQEKTFHQ